MNTQHQTKTSAAPGILLILLSIAFVGFLFWSAQQLPEQVATRFGFDGRPVKWMNRSAAITLMAGFGLGLPVLMVLISFLVRVLPASSINVPNREHWLAPERRDQTYSFIVRKMLWLSCLLVCFMAGFHWIVLQANKSIPVQMPTNLLLTAFGVYLACMAVWIVTFVRHFLRPNPQ
jgi:uncharacterized membrane protein